MLIVLNGTMHQPRAVMLDLNLLHNASYEQYSMSLRHQCVVCNELHLLVCLCFQGCLAALCTLPTIPCNCLRACTLDPDSLHTM